MQLEVIEYLPKTASNHPPFLFVHGAFAGAWCWEEHFLPYFAENGYAAYAVSLRGHGKSKGHVTTASLDNYVTDVASITNEFDQPPILVGHSMGGMVVQKFLEKHSVTAAILMNSVPPSGLWESSCYMMMNDPWLYYQLGLMQTLGIQFATVNGVRRALFSADVPHETVKRYFSYVQDESQRVVMDMMGMNLPAHMPQTQVPMLVLGASNDAFFPTSSIKNTARHYNASIHIFDNMAHAMMLESRWQEVADYILAWIGEYPPQVRRRLQQKMDCC